MSQSINFSSVKRANFNSTRLKEILLNGNLIWKEAKECKETGTFESSWQTPGMFVPCLSLTTSFAVDMCPGHKYNFKWLSVNVWASFGSTQSWKVTEIYEDGYTQSYSGSHTFYCSCCGGFDYWQMKYIRDDINRTSHSSHGNLKTLKYQTGSPCWAANWCSRQVKGVFRL